MYLYISGCLHILKGKENLNKYAVEQLRKHNIHVSNSYSNDTQESANQNSKKQSDLFMSCTTHKTRVYYLNF